MRLISFLFILIITSSSFAQRKMASPESLTRRLYLDLYDRLPTDTEYDLAMKYIKANKYNLLVDKMTSTKFFRSTLSQKIVDHYGTKERRIVRKEPQLLKYIQDKYAGRNVDFRDFLYDFVTARGISYSNPLVNLYSQDEAVPDLTSRMAERVMGLPYNCARCHDHKDYDEIKQKDFWQLASFFNATQKSMPNKKDQLERLEKRMDKMEKLVGSNQTSAIKEWIKAEKKGKNINGSEAKRNMNNPDRLVNPQLILTESSHGLKNVYIKYKVEGKVFTAKPELPGNIAIDVNQNKPPRQVLGEWVRDPNNDYPSKAVVNWVSFWLLGRGWVTPVTDVYGGFGVREKELDRYATYFRQNNYNLVNLVRHFVKSPYYKMANMMQTSEKHITYYQARKARHLTGSQIINSIKYFGSNSALSGNEKRRVDQATDTLFPTSLQDDESFYRGTLAQTLFMANNSFLGNYIDKVAKNAHKDRELKKDEWLRKVYVTFLTREPSSRELRELSYHFSNRKSYDKSGFYEVVWAIVNSPEMRLY